MTHTMDYCFGDLAATVVFTDDGASAPYSDDPLSGGIHISHVYVGHRIDIIDALTDAQLAEVAHYAVDYCQAA